MDPEDATPSRPGARGSAPILVTGAAGKTGRAVLRRLGAGALRTRALAYRTEQAERLRRSGVDEVLVGDLVDRVAVRAAVRSAAAVYHICPNVHPQELAIGRNVVAAAAAEEVERFVYHSVLHPQIEAMPHHWEKLRVEEHLLESGVPCTILQPAPYMQNVLANWHRIKAEGRYPVPYAASARLALVDLEDVAEVAARVLVEPGHLGAAYQLCGEVGLTQTEVAALLSRGLGRPVEVEVIPGEAWASTARAAGLGEYQLEALLAMFVYYERHGLTGGCRVLESLLAGPPCRFEQFVARAVEADDAAKKSES